MKFIRNNSNNPYFNIALEEYCLENIETDEDYFIVWQNKPSVIVGSHQNVFQEINSCFVKEKNIPVVRRISGGGTVYHDFGNINFTFIFNNHEEYINYLKHNQMIMSVLFELGLKTTMSERHDILYQGKKISGNAQRVHNRRVLHHGTILFDADIDKLVKALNVGIQSIESKAIQSVRSLVVNIKDKLNVDMTTEEFKEYLIKSLSNNYKDQQILLDSQDIDKINEKVKNKFSTWEWNYGESPKFEFQNFVYVKDDLWNVEMKVKNGIIMECKLQKNNKDYINQVAGERYEINALNNKVTFIERKDLFNLFFG